MERLGFYFAVFVLYAIVATNAKGEQPSPAYVVQSDDDPNVVYIVTPDGVGGMTVTPGIKAEPDEDTTAPGCVDPTPTIEVPAEQ
jgi:hypothetical protein